MITDQTLSPNQSPKTLDRKRGSLWIWVALFAIFACIGIFFVRLSEDKLGNGDSTAQASQTQGAKPADLPFVARFESARASDPGTSGTATRAEGEQAIKQRLARASEQLMATLRASGVTGTMTSAGSTESMTIMMKEIDGVVCARLDGVSSAAGDVSTVISNAEGIWMLMGDKTIQANFMRNGVEDLFNGQAASNPALRAAAVDNTYQSEHFINDQGVRVEKITERFSPNYGQALREVVEKHLPAKGQMKLESLNNLFPVASVNYINPATQQIMGSYQVNAAGKVVGNAINYQATPAKDQPISNSTFSPPSNSEVFTAANAREFNWLLTHRKQKSNTK